MDVYGAEEGEKKRVRGKREGKHARCGCTEDVIQHDTEAESNISRQCNLTMYDVMNERSP